ncbi:ABC transporter ATP-binding protein [Streptosporangium saharense]|uniref:ABC-2 type transport system ATP-binding protein n=1 Tax=Streptosporangium saharense TaxID=1706840 RepID=A0A7W7QJ25_9ACTN|nr:ABC transporter ATP-binding protein [Streptosporangium saharense]MBB4914515.1 ABC-2 type transport system ATP-binding protein [Streptosporangium saharense]
MHTFAISASGLRASFGDRTVLDGLTLEIPRGTVFALLGAEGSGKTTMIRILSGLLAADEGRVRFAGERVGRHSPLDDSRTGAENLLLLALRHGLDQERAVRHAAGLLDRLGLAEAAELPVAAYSGGMRRRLGIATALVGAPEVVLLDEPTGGLDPRGRRAVRRVLRDLAAEGVTVFLTTRHLRDAGEIADRVAVLSQGRIVAEGTPEELGRLTPGGHAHLRFADAEELEWAARALGGVPGDDEAFTLRVPNDGSVGSLRALLARIDHQLLAVDGLSVHAPDPDDVFLALTTPG